MPTYLQHIKLSFGGEIGSFAEEQWTNTVRFKRAIVEDPLAPSDGISSDDLDASLALLVAPLRTWFGSAGTGIGNVASLLWAKLNMIGVDGKQRDINTHRIEIARLGGGLNASAPWYQTYALTHRTALARGRGHSGRIFPPLVAFMPAVNSPYVGGGVADQMAANWATCLQAISQVIKDQSTDGPGLAVDCYPVVASPVSTTGPNQGPAMLNRVTGVVCDRVPDVQHRRTYQVQRSEGALAPVAGA